MAVKETAGYEYRAHKPDIAVSAKVYDRGVGTINIIFEGQPSFEELQQLIMRIVAEIQPKGGRQKDD